MYMALNMLGRQIHTAEPLVPVPSAFEVEMAIEELKSHITRYWSDPSRTDYKAGNTTIHSEIHKLINSIWNKEELPEEWKESITVHIYKKGNKTDCSHCRGISLLSTTYKILSSILLSR
jgi:hypothetical protein